MPVRKAEAEWKTLREGSGKVKLGERRVRRQLLVRIALRKRQGNESRGVARRGACGMLLHGACGRIDSRRISAEARSHDRQVHIDKVGAGFEITKIELDCEAQVPKIDENMFHAEAAAAKEGCPLSKALKATPIVLKAKLLR